MKNSHKIGLFSAIIIPITSMIGSGWLFSAQLSAQISGNYAFLAWCLAAVVAILVGMCFAKLCALHPVRGLNAKCVSISHGSEFGMAFGFAIWFGLLLMVPTEAQATTQYLAPFIAKYVIIYENDSLTIAGKLFAIAILFGYLVVNFFGLKFLSKVNNIATVFKVSIPVITIVVLIAAYFGADHNNFNLAVNSVIILSQLYKPH